MYATSSPAQSSQPTPLQGDRQTRQLPSPANHQRQLRVPHQQSNHQGLGTGQHQRHHGNVDQRETTSQATAEVASHTLSEAANPETTPRSIREFRRTLSPVDTEELGPKAQQDSTTMHGENYR